MTPSMSIEQKSRPTAKAATPSQAFDLAGLIGDGTARASDDGRRRVLACPAFPAGATPRVCVAAWHATGRLADSFRQWGVCAWPGSSS